MRYIDIPSMLDETDIPYTYYSFPEKEAPNLPYITFYYPDSSNMAADNTVYQRIESLTIELYTENKDIELEKRVEDVFERYNIVWDKSEDYINSEHMFMITYETEIYING